MRNTFVNTLVELAKKDRDIELVTGDLGFGVLKPLLGAAARPVRERRHCRAEYDDRRRGHGA